MQNHKTYVTTLPDFIQIQKTSFCWFISQGLSEELENFSSILDFTGNIEVCIFGNEYKLKKPKYSEFESKQRDSTYSARIYIPIEIRDRQLKRITNRKNVFIGTLPLMTNNATFIINGCERIIISQIIRSPGIYFKKVLKKDRPVYNGTLISNRGSWLKFEFGEEDDSLTKTTKRKKSRNIFIKIDKSTKISATQLLNEMGLNNAEIAQSVKTPSYFNSAFNLSTAIDVKNNEFETPFFNENSTIFSKIFDQRYYDVGKVGRRKINQKLNLNISENIHTLTYQDIIGIFDYLITIQDELGVEDDIDHLQNRKVRSVGELLQNQFKVGLNRLERTIKERMTICDPLTLKPTTLINPKPVMATMKEFFGSSQLSQFMDQTNPLSALTHRRRISGLGPGGFDRDRISFAVRDIHPSHYGRICPIETPEGQNAGLIASLTTCARVNPYGFYRNSLLES